MKLNVGCGPDIRPGYINIDWNPASGVNIVSDARALPFADCSVDEVLASDILEHFPWAEVRDVLREWKRVLKGGGRLELRTPDLGGLVRLYNARRPGWRREDGVTKGVDPIVERLYGGQDFHGNFHYVIFDQQSLRELLEEEGFLVVNISPDVNDISNLIATAVRRLCGEEAYVAESDCPAFATCPIVRDFMRRADQIEIVDDVPIRFCSDDIRFYEPKHLTSRSLSKLCPRLAELRAELEEGSLTWQGPTFGPSGYAFAARGYLIGLDELGCPARCQPLWGDCKLSFKDVSDE
ncbi:putative SAM-dependent methyltransferase [Desulfobaculum xiamenense]|uniref:Putative SAM-dependent methyltransferase n=1 Tax=Desulfobaculum xiamenense TaxID=995050 RepID=A0A846QED3_9BACT|nr:methyltransferase domain-containing protein [Desulfobaculum xiamenense]NJB66728.1 putative SAM-dependent methyltransferase [Desulfobaculum xiamenense]